MVDIVAWVTVLVFAQTSEPPESTYIFQLEDGREYYARSYREERDSRGRRLFVLELDQPWRPGTRTVRGSELRPNSPVRELASAREQRIRAGWEELGYHLVRLPSGELAPVPKAEYELSERAREWALAVETHVQELDTVADPEPPDVPTADSPMPALGDDASDTAQSGPGIWIAGIVLAALVAMGLTLKILVLA